MSKTGAVITLLVAALIFFTGMKTGIYFFQTKSTAWLFYDRVEIDSPVGTVTLPIEGSVYSPRTTATGN